MTINVNRLIESIGVAYQEIYERGLIPYKSQPSGFSGADKIELDMKKEGVYLSFLREGRILNSCA
ncbi:DUF6392 family protein [Tenebrionibacter intestinalis]|jgi:hypothetical protein|uniref:Uncharacterized protein n=1 Tax=Tenebrionibacter intestinalis TaxID=2799638 RepID=A0A8K0V5J7_9ENTR|nr:DUF6392 family protein [Tenebrionibacter intestinalis]MBK4717221.1 hypothetical protein [Tenebrionibacter intestinalis]